MIRVRRIVSLAVLAVLALPEVLHACPVCFDARDENRLAFLGTTAFLSLLPLGMVAGVVLWFRRQYRISEMSSRGGEAPEAISTPS